MLQCEGLECLNRDVRKGMWIERRSRRDGEKTEERENNEEKAGKDKGCDKN